VTVSDIRSAESLAREIPALLDEGIMVEAGGHGLLTFRARTDCGEPRRAAGYARTGAGPQLWPPVIASWNWPHVSERQDPGHYRLQRQDHHDGAGRRNPKGVWSADAGCRQHWRAGGGPDRREHRRHVVGAGGFQLSTRIHGKVPPEDRRHSEHHPRSSRPARHFENYALAKERIFAVQDAGTLRC